MNTAAKIATIATAAAELIGFTGMMIGIYTLYLIFE
jgi:hypothetical protein